MQSPAWLNLPAAETGKADESVKKRKALASGAASSGGEAGAGHSRGLVEVLAKLSLSNAQAVRDLQSSVLRTALVASDSPLAEALAATGKGYHDKVQGAKEHKLGPPAVHLWATAVRVAIESGAVRGDHLERLKEHWNDELQKVPPESLAQFVRLFRVHKTHRADRKRLSFHVVPVDLEDAFFLRALVQLGAELRFGTAPAREMERVVQRALERSGGAVAGS